MVTKEFMTIAETANHTGLSISHLRRLTAQGKIAHSKPNGKIIYINIIDLNKFLSKNRKAAVK